MTRRISLVIAALVVVVSATGAQTQIRLRVAPSAEAALCDETASASDMASASALQSWLTTNVQAGEIACLPSGTYEWTDALSWTAPSNTQLWGAGSRSTTGGGDVTVITDSYASTSPQISIETPTSGYFRLSAITFQGGSAGSNQKTDGIIKMTGKSQSVRIDHVHFDLSTYSPAQNNTAIHFYNWIYGVIDHVVIDLIGIGNGLRYAHDQYNDDAGSHADAAWAGATDFGTASFIFTEDSQFNSTVNTGTVNDCNGGGRFVFRYNTAVNAGLQTHPTGGSGRGRGCRASEIYQNTFTTDLAEPPFNMFFLSSGPALIWGNAADESHKNFVTLHSMRRDNSTYSESATPDGWGYCGTEFNGTGSDWDENSSASTGYHCLDQPGMGQGDLLSGDFPNAENTESMSISWPNQALEPLYEWLNTGTPATGWGGSYWAVVDSGAFVEDTDYFLYTGSFDGTAGVGSGTLASRPPTCTAGVAYWGTDTTTLYTCTATDTWGTYYTPYTYPHPLQGSLND